VSHEILNRRFGQVRDRELAWHSLQNATFQPGCTVMEAAEQVGATFNIDRLPVFVRYPDGTEVPFPNHFGLVRPPLADVPGYAPLQVVGASYELVQHTDFCRALDPLTKEGWQVETLGVLSEGAQVFVCFAAGGFVVNGDDLDLLWCASDTKDGGAMSLFSTHTRVVCKNTYRIAEGSALQRLQIPHYRGAKAELDFAVQVLAATQSAQADFKATLEQFGRTRLVDEQIAAILERAYPTPAMPRRAKMIDELSKNGGFAVLGPDMQAEYTALQREWLSEREHVEATREAVVERTDIFGQERPDFGGTAWALWNGVTEIANYAKGQGRAQSILFGRRGSTMQTAYKALCEVSGVNLN
jgi:hypothetical protein